MNTATPADPWRRRVEEIAKDHPENSVATVLRSTHLYDLCERASKELFAQDPSDLTLSCLRMLHGRYRLSVEGKGLLVPSSKIAKVDVAKGICKVLDKNLT